MAMPKKKMTSTRSGNRRSKLALNRQAMTVCTNCKKSILPHTACQYCGFYKGQKVK